MSAKTGEITNGRAPFVMVSKKLAEDPDISASAKSVYMALCRFSDNMTRVANPGRRTIRQVACVSDSTLSRSLEALEEAGYIRITPNYRKDFHGNYTGERLSNSYHIENV